MDQENEVEKNEMDIFLAWLSPDPETAAFLYLELRRKLVFIFRFFNDPEDLAGEVFKRTLNNINKGKVEYNGKAEHYVSKIAHFVKKEQFRKKPEYPLDEKINNMSSDLHKNGFPEDLYQLIESCLRQIPANEREIFLEYSFTPDGVPSNVHRQNVAEKRNINIRSLRVLIHRIKNKLRDCAGKKLGEME